MWSGLLRTWVQGPGCVFLAAPGKTLSKKLFANRAPFSILSNDFSLLYPKAVLIGRVLLSSPLPIVPVQSPGVS